MKLEDEIGMHTFRSPFQKAYLNILFTGNWLEARVESLIKPFGISPEQYNVLRILRGQQGKPINLFEVQERMLSRMSNATRLVEKLRLKELVTREVCVHNRRKVEISITPKGLRLLDKLDPLVEEQEKLLFEHIEATDVESLSQVLDKLRGD
ncbi:MarR family transcriptional regulator [Pontibacter qinzhouensis]|uniref:MarR family transcriptional regulator n=1 Tax=Pontibacter qinzhouensis TaxID=2603253 RepID=A0A5C8K548_9BACT|nr:MarR family transcriptional regulator [Pontibacter qinzhouensis]TXK45757.1 MarR family transcriptional regulator [Pontibacter qinzhouensis]